MGSTTSNFTSVDSATESEVSTYDGTVETSGIHPHGGTDARREYVFFLGAFGRMDRSYGGNRMRNFERVANDDILNDGGRIKDWRPICGVQRYENVVRQVIRAMINIGHRGANERRETDAIMNQATQICDYRRRSMDRHLKRDPHHEYIYGVWLGCVEEYFGSFR